MVIPVKECRYCHDKLPVEQFHSNRNSPDGMHPYCKKCNSLVTSRNRHVKLLKARIQKEALRDGLAAAFKPTEDRLVGFLSTAFKELHEEFGVSLSYMNLHHKTIEALSTEHELVCKSVIIALVKKLLKEVADGS